MSFIIRGTTPTIVFRFSKVNVEDIVTAIFTVKQNGSLIIEKDLSEAIVGDSDLAWKLSQSESLSLKVGKAAMMCNFVLDSGIRGASLEHEVGIYKNHKNEVI